MVVRRVVQEGDTFAQAAAWAHVSKSTVWEWVRRWREASPADQQSLACLGERLGTSPSPGRTSGGKRAEGSRAA